MVKFALLARLRAKPEKTEGNTFAAESGRTAHLDGPIAAALAANASALLSAPPSISRVDVLGAKI